MATEFVRLLRQDQPVLPATLISEGLLPAALEATTGWKYGVDEHRYRAGVHRMSGADHARLTQVIAGAGPELWPDFSARGASRASALAETARSVSGEGTDDLAAGFRALAAASRAMAPFLALNGEVRRALARPEATDAVQEMRAFYALAGDFAQDTEAMDLVTNRAPMIALMQLEARSPSLRERITHHVEEWGWIRQQADRRVEPTSPKDIVQRLQKVLLRWPPEAIQQAAEPGDELAFRGGALLQAFGIARPFLGRVALSLGCSEEQLMGSSAGEVADALAARSQIPLPEVDARIRNGFAIERSGADLQVVRHPGVEAVPDSVTGQTVSVGRAVGRVRIVRQARDIGGLDYGDVLVTGLSAPDRMGIESAFPTREGPPPGTERVAAIVADEGGLLSHAATISRELGIPCVVGTERATSILEEGQGVEVDATKEVGRVIVYGEA